MRQNLTVYLPTFATTESERLYAGAYAAALKLWPVPYEDRILTCAYGETHLVLSGPTSGTPILLFHPAGCGSMIWCRNVKGLSRTHRVIAVDTLGEVNRSRVARPLKDRKALLEWVGHLFDGLQIDRADIVGNSFGGYLGALVAMTMPEKVNRLALISPAATFARMWPWFWHFMPAYGTGSKRLKKLAYDWIWQGYPVDGCIAEMRAIGSMSGVPRHQGPQVFTDGELGRIKAPVLLLIGDHEVVYDARRVMERAKRVVVHLQAEIVPGGNHNCEYTAADYVNQKLAAFLSV